MPTCHFYGRFFCLMTSIIHHFPFKITLAVVEKIKKPDPRYPTNLLFLHHLRCLLRMWKPAWHLKIRQQNPRDWSDDSNKISYESMSLTASLAQCSSKTGALHPIFNVFKCKSLFKIYGLNNSQHSYQQYLLVQQTVRTSSQLTIQESSVFQGHLILFQRRWGTTAPPYACWVLAQASPALLEPGPLVLLTGVTWFWRNGWPALSLAALSVAEPRLSQVPILWAFSWTSLLAAALPSCPACSHPQGHLPSSGLKP